MGGCSAMVVPAAPVATAATPQPAAPVGPEATVGGCSAMVVPAAPVATAVSWAAALVQAPGQPELGANTRTRSVPSSARCSVLGRRPGPGPWPARARCEHADSFRAELSALQCPVAALRLAGLPTRTRNGRRASVSHGRARAAPGGGSIEACRITYPNPQRSAGFGQPWPGKGGPGWWGAGQFDRCRSALACPVSLVRFGNPASGLRRARRRTIRSLPQRPGMSRQSGQIRKSGERAPQG